MRWTRIALAIIIIIPSTAAVRIDGLTIYDPRGDHEVDGSLKVVVPEIDILSLSATRGPVTTTFRLMTDNLSWRTPGAVGAVYAITYQAAEEFATILAVRTAEDWSFHMVKETSEGLSVHILNGHTDGSSFVVEAPTSAVHPEVESPRVSSLLVVRESGGLTGSGGAIWFRDAAPNRGFVLGS